MRRKDQTPRNLRTQQVIRNKRKESFKRFVNARRWLIRKQLSSKRRDDRRNEAEGTFAANSDVQAVNSAQSATCLHGKEICGRRLEETGVGVRGGGGGWEEMGELATG